MAFSRARLWFTLVLILCLPVVLGAVVGMLRWFGVFDLRPASLSDPGALLELSLFAVYAFGPGLVVLAIPFAIALHRQRGASRQAARAAWVLVAVAMVCSAVSYLWLVNQDFL